MKKNSICLISSAGGHLSQIKQLLNIAKNYEYFFVVEKNATTQSLNKSHSVYYLIQQERKNTTFIFKLILNCFISLFIYFKERPKIIITTGAGAVIPFCILGKLMGSKLIFIESFAKVKTPTRTGRLLYKYADYFYIQWPELKKFYPNALYRGKIY